MTEIVSLLLKTKVQVTAFVVGLIFIFIPVIVPFSVAYAKKEWSAEIQIPLWFIWSICILGCLLFFVSAFGFIMQFFKKGIEKEKKIAAFKSNNTQINIVVGRLNKVKNITENSAFVSSIDTRFSYECVSTEDTAAHSLLTKFNTKNLPSFEKDIQEALKNVAHNNGIYHQGTTVIMPEKYNCPSKFIFTACALYNERYPCSPESIMASISNILIKTENTEIDTLFLSVLGSGQAGMEIEMALSHIVSGFNYYLRYRPHIKTVNIYILPEKYKKMKKPLTLPI